MISMDFSSLPIAELLPQLNQRLAEHTSLVLEAPPGAGKTSTVPLSLLQAPWLGGQKIIMLEPRRLAARSAAQRLAELLGEHPGQTVGYRMRLEQCIGSDTRIEVITEGVLTRLIQNDPALEGIGLVIFDEFHERSLQADLGLALCLDSQAGLREDLRILVMSATLDGQAVARLMGDSVVLSSPGRSFPVDYHYHPINANFEQQWHDYCRLCAAKVAQIASEHAGSILVFLPGIGEITRVHEYLAGQLSGAIQSRQLLLCALHGQLSLADQRNTIQPAPSGTQKIVLATSIAETSLTIEGIEVVIDSGLMRLPHFDPKTGLTRLKTLRVSQATAVQRAGRAGRLGPGHAYRLWSEQLALIPYSPVEMLQADLAPLAMELAQWGVQDAEQLQWLTPPPAAALSQARSLLQLLQAMDEQGRLTPHGLQMAALSSQPRLSHMMLKAGELGLTKLACELAALLEERDLCPESKSADILLRLQHLQASSSQRPSALTHRLRQQAVLWQRQLTSITKPTPIANNKHQARLQKDSSSLSLEQQVALLLAYAYPDRIAQKRQQSADTKNTKYLLSNGRGAELRMGDHLSSSPYLVAAWLDDGRNARIRLAVRLDANVLADFHPYLFQQQEHIAWDANQQCVIAESQVRVGACIYERQALPEPESEEIKACLLQGIRELGLQVLPWDRNSHELRQRIRFLSQLMPSDWPTMDEQSLLASLDQWLGPYLNGMSRSSHLKSLDLSQILRDQLNWAQQQQLDEWAPSHLQVPSGSKIKINYETEQPILAVRLQEVFGLMDTPVLAAGQVKVLMHLLSPAQRPVQITQDLATFWQHSYHDVKKELKGRYPKHYWPDDPSQAQATRHTKARR